MRDVFLGADLGTSGLKLVVLDAEGAPVGEAETAYPVETPRPGWAEIDPRAWVVALRSALQQVAPEMTETRVLGLGIDGQMHGLVLSDERGAPCRPAILWPDRRAEHLVPGWRALPSEVRARLANPLVPGMTGPILEWITKHEPLAVARAATVLLPKDWLRLQLGGPPVTDRSDASATLLWDVTAEDWARDLMDARKLPARLLPEVVPSQAVVATANLSSFSRCPDLSAAVEVPIIVGCADTPAALLALGGLPAGVVQVNLGTGAQVLHAVPTPTPAPPDPVTHLYCDAEQGWYRMAAVQNAGLALDRVRALLILSWDELFALADSSAPGANGVSFLPFLTGERGGVASPSSRGAWLGIDDRTTRADLSRAALEAVLFSVRRGLELLSAVSPRIHISGGGARHSLMPQTLANLLDAEVVVLAARSASAAGAAMLAARAQRISLPLNIETSAPLKPERSPDLEAAYQRWLARLASTGT